MNTWRVILATLVIFGAGVITGGLLVGYTDRAAHQAARVAALAETQRAERQPVPVQLDTGPTAIRENRVPLLRKEFLERLHRELKLTPEQREQIETIIRQGQEHTRDLWQAEMRVTRQKIRAVLTHEQQTRFQELLKQRLADERRAARREAGATNAPGSSVSSNPAPPAPQP